ncbi:unnamed protein product, partial [Brassica rapa subsp. narinosa]
ISVDRGSKATLPLTIPCRDSTRRSVVIIIQGSPNGLSQRHVPLGAKAPTEGQQSGGGRMCHL